MSQSGVCRVLNLIELQVMSDARLVLVAGLVQLLRVEELLQGGGRRAAGLCEAAQGGSSAAAGPHHHSPQ